MKSGIHEATSDLLEQPKLDAATPDNLAEQHMANESAGKVQLCAPQGGGISKWHKPKDFQKKQYNPQLLRIELRCKGLKTVPAASAP